MQRIKGVVFDLDGTLLNTLDDLTAAVNYGLAACGLPARSRDEVCSFVGNGMERLIALSVPEGSSENTRQAVFAAFKEYYAQHGQDQTAPYPGIIELLAALREAEIPMAVVSNKLEEAVECLRAHYFGEYIRVAAGDRPGRQRKPAPDSTFAALEQLDLAPEEALFVGDSDVDIMTAENAGMPCLSVSWGFRDEAFLLAHGAKAIAATAEEATQYILERI